MLRESPFNAIDKRVGGSAVIVAFSMVRGILYSSEKTFFPLSIGLRSDCSQSNCNNVIELNSDGSDSTGIVVDAIRFRAVQGVQNLII